MRKWIEAQAVAQEAGDLAVMGVGAGADALIAASAFFEIEDEQALRVHEALGEIAVERDIALGAALLGEIFCGALSGDVFEAVPHRGEAVQHLVEVFRRDLDQLDMIQGGASGVAFSGDGATLEREQPHLAEVATTRQVGEDEVFAVVDLRDLYEADAHKIESVGVRALFGDHLAGSEADELDAVLEEGDEVVVERRKYGHAEQVSAESAGAVVAVELFAEGLVLLQNVEHIAQHLEHDAIGLGADCC